MDHPSRRDVLRLAGGSLLSSSWLHRPAWGQVSPPQTPPHAPVKILQPRDRVPLAFIIDDSTCLVNMGHFCMPQFATAWPDQAIYKKPWKSWPREIPDAFVREFGEWCARARRQRQVQYRALSGLRRLVGSRVAWLVPRGTT